MIITRIIGGLGNQMFQYAIGRSLANKLNTELKLDISGFDTYELHKYQLSQFNIVENFATESEINNFKKRRNKFVILLNKLSLLNYKNKIYSEKRIFYFDPDVFKQKGNIYLSGYWQTSKYFENISTIIRNDFSVKSDSKGQNRDMLLDITESNSVAIHIRRGDYVSDPKTSNVYNICSLDYYEKCIELINKKIDSPKFFIFSDDPKWVKDNLKIPDNLKVFVSHNTPDEAHEDLRLMKNCKHFIIANSTFSWWGAWLSNNPGKIIFAPKRWMKEDIIVKDLILKDWIRL